MAEPCRAGSHGVWPPRAAPESEPFCHTVKLTLPQLEKANEEGFAVDQGRRCITREAMRAHDEYLAQRARSKAERDANESRRALEQKLGIEVGETTEDGLFTLQRSECMGACADAPVMLVNDRHMCSFMSGERMAALVDELKTAEGQA